MTLRKPSTSPLILTSASHKPRIVLGKRYKYAVAFWLIIPHTTSVFETTIRYVGGLLSAYELSGQKYPILVEKAKEVADKMAFAWVGVSINDFILCEVCLDVLLNS